MKTSYFSLIASLLLCVNVSVSAQADEFRKSNWGDSLSQVKQAEKASLVKEEDNGLMYKAAVANLDAVIFYGFLDGKLVSGGYQFIEVHSNKNAYIDDFEKLKGLLTKKYGQPSLDKVVWKNDLYKDNPQEYGTALSLDHLAYLADWKTASTEVNLMLTGENFKISHVLFYKSLVHEKAVQEKNEQKALSDL